MTTEHSPITTDELDEWERLLEGVTPGPWLTPAEAGRRHEHRLTWDEEQSLILDHEGCEVWPWREEADMTFAYKAREIVPRLIEEVKRLRGIIDGLDFELDSRLRVSSDPPSRPSWE